MSNKNAGTKSHVGIGVTLCPVCGIEHDEVVLLNTRLRNTLEQKQVTGWGMCAEHKRLFDKGYIALIETNNKPTSLNDADRTGNIAHVRSAVWPQIFNCPVPSKGICFVQPGVLAKIQEMVNTDQATDEE